MPPLRHSIESLKLAGQQVTLLSFSPSARMLLSLTDTAGKQRLVLSNLSNAGRQALSIEVEPEKGIERVFETRRHTDLISDARLSPDETLLLAGSWDGTARLWHVPHGVAAGVLAGHKERVLTASFSRDGHMAVTGGSDGTARVWDISNPNDPKALSVFDVGSAVTAAEFSPDMQFVLTGDEGAHVRVWDFRSRRQIFRFGRHHAAVDVIRFAHDSQRLLTADRDGVVWDWSLCGPVPAADALQRLITDQIPSEFREFALGRSESEVPERTNEHALLSRN